MTKKEYSRNLTTGAIVHAEGESLVIDGPAHMDGSTLVIDSVNFLPQEVDYTDNDSVKILATSAVHTADGFCNLVKQNCNTSDPDISHDAHLEMYLALSGLACAIYMKAIIYHENLHGGKQVRGHKLDELLTLLPTSVQGVVSNKINSIKLFQIFFSNILYFSSPINLRVFNSCNQIVLHSLKVLLRYNNDNYTTP